MPAGYLVKPYNPHSLRTTIEVAFADTPAALRGDARSADRPPQPAPPRERPETARAVFDAAFGTMAAEQYQWHVGLEAIEISISLRSSAALTGFLR